MRLLIVHASDALAKGFVAIPPDRHTEDGRPTNALYGVTGAVREALGFKVPDRAVAVVARARSEGWPDALRSQAKALPSLLEAHGFTVVTVEDPEHVVASYVHAALAVGDDVVVLGSDKRLAQLVGDRVWWFDGYKRVRYTPDAVRKRFGVGPSSVAGWLALVGDNDALTGVKGIGKKGAVDLIEAVGSVSAALADPEAVEVRAGKALRASLDEARRQLDIAVLHTDRPVPVALEDLSYASPGVGALNEVYASLAFWHLLAADPEAPPKAYTVCGSEAEVAAALAGLGDGAVAVHPIIEAPSPVRGRLVGLALSARRGEAVYVPFAGEGTVVSPAVLADWLFDEGRAKVGHDSKATVVAFARLGIEVRGIVGDSCIASHLADPTGGAPHDLTDTARVRLKRPVVEADAVLGRGAQRKAFADLPVGEAGAYACHLADTVGELWRLFAPSVDAALLAETLELAETLVRMERHGMLVSRTELAGAREDFARRGAVLEGQIHALAGHPFSVGSPKQLGTVLFEELGIPVLSRTKTGYSTATHVLERQLDEHPIVALVIEWRRLRRLTDAWVTALLGHLDDDDRVRSTVHPARSFSGRLINSQPDLGRVPGRTEDMARIRRAFRVAPGHTMLSVDYDQLGLYLIAHLTEDPALVEPLRRGDDLHRLTAAAILEVDPAQVTRDMRQIGKVVNFATFAGQGASALALQLGDTAQVAKEYIARFDAHYAGVRAFQEGQLRLAEERGYIETIAGRRQYIHGMASLDTQMQSYAARMARRATHEASVADVCRRGLLHADRAIRAAGLQAVPLLQVLDEVLFEVPDDELEDTARVAAEAMGAAYDLLVPLRLGCKVGPSWADLEPL